MKKKRSKNEIIAKYDDSIKKNDSSKKDDVSTVNEVEPEVVDEIIEETIDIEEEPEAEEEISDLEEAEVLEETVEVEERPIELKEEIEAKDTVIKDETKKSKKSVYFSFNLRLFVNIVVLIALLVALGYCGVRSFFTPTDEIVKYNVNSDIKYKVYLKPNDFYDEPYLEEGMVYVSSLIKKININYKYNFMVDKNSDIDFSYKVVAKLVIASQSNSNVFFTKEYDLTEEKNEEIVDKISHTINESIDLDYVYYNNLANRFRSKYAVNTNSYLDVYLVVNEKSKENNTYDLNKESKVILTIPLSMQELNITLDNKNINETKELVVHHTGIARNTLTFVIMVILIVAIGIVGYALVKKVLLLTNNTNKYDNYVNRLLRGFDRIIVTVKTMPNFENNEIVKVVDFQELVDVRDNLKVPINYFVITEHQKCEFYVYGSNNQVYLYILKAIDLEEDARNEKEGTRT